MHSIEGLYSILLNCIELRASTILLKISRHFTGISKFLITSSLHPYKEGKVDYFISLEFYYKCLFMHDEVLSKVLFSRSHSGMLVELEKKVLNGYFASGVF